MPTTHHLNDEPPTGIVPKRVRPERFVKNDPTEGPGDLGPSLDVLIRLPDLTRKEPRPMISRVREMKPAAIASLSTGLHALGRRPRLLSTVGVGIVATLIAIAFLPGDEKPLPSIEAPAWSGDSMPLLEPHTAANGDQTHDQDAHTTDVSHRLPLGEDDPATSAAEAKRPLRIELEGAKDGSDNRSAGNVPGQVSHDDLPWSNTPGGERSETIDQSSSLPKIRYPSTGASQVPSIARNSALNTPTTAAVTDANAANTAGRIGSSQRMNMTKPADSPSLGIPQRIVKRLLVPNFTANHGPDVQPPSETNHERSRSRVY